MVFQGMKVTTFTVFAHFDLDSFSRVLAPFATKDTAPFEISAERLDSDMQLITLKVEDLSTFDEGVLYRKLKSLICVKNISLDGKHHTHDTQGKVNGITPTLTSADNHSPSLQTAAQ